MRIVLIVLVFALTLYALLDCARTPEESMPARMPKFLWIILIVLFPTIGPIAWIITSRVKAAEAAGGLDEQTRADLAAATQAAIVEVLAAKAVRALKQTGLKRLVVAGGVGANQLLRARLAAALKPLKATAYFPPLALCTDNGAMIAFAAAERVKAGLAVLDADAPHSFTVRPRWDLAEIG